VVDEKPVEAAKTVEESPAKAKTAEEPPTEAKSVEKLTVLDNGHQPQKSPISVTYAAFAPRFASFRLADTGLNNVLTLLLTALDNGPTPALTADVRTSLLATVH
jgi:hypothetical protein